MVFPRLTVSTLLASFLLLLYWSTSSAQSHDLTSSALSLPSRVKRDQPFETREKVRATFDVVKDTLSGFQDVSEVTRWASSSKDVIKKLAKFASLAPGCAGVLFSAVNMVLAFIPQDDPVLNAVKEGFAEVNRKLDSISIQISNLATDVEWFNYASVYSQDELRILNAWTKLNEFMESSKLARSEDEKLRQAELFTNYYEYTGTEASVSNLYHYLTVRSKSLSRNLNELLSMKFKCDIREIGRYNYYFMSLLVKGTALNEAYWKLIGLNPPNKEAKRAQMFRKVYKSQLEAIASCQKNVKQLVGNDVLETTKGLSADDKTVIAKKVKEALDEKYDWYDWVVLVYNTDEDANYMLHDLTKIPVGKVTVAVDYKLKAPEQHVELVKDAINNCFTGEYCDTVKTDKQKCKATWNDPTDHHGEHRIHIWLPDHVKATHVIYRTEFAEVPEPFHKYECTWSRSTSYIYMHYSRSTPVCEHNPCQNGGQCARLLDSNDSLCECQDGYYGDTCEEKMDTSWVQQIDVSYPVPSITTMNGRLRDIENKLQQLISRNTYG